MMFLCISLDKTTNVKGLHIDDNINSPNVHLHAHFDFNFKKYEKIYVLKPNSKPFKQIIENCKNNVTAQLGKFTK